MTGLRARLVLATGAGSLLAVAALVVVFNLVLDAGLRGDVDRLLRERAAAQLRTVAVVDGHLRVPEAPDQAAPDTRTWIFSEGRFLEQPTPATADQSAVLRLLASGGTYATVSSTNDRLHAVTIAQRSQPLGTVVVAASLDSYQRSAHTALIASIVLGALTVLGIVAVSGWVIRRALAPVARMTADAVEWGERDLARRFFAGTPHDELSELAATFDRLLDRLAQALRREQRFTAEISHELRTPLAKIAGEAELALGGEHPPGHYRRALESIRASAADLGQALDALLAAARADPAGAGQSADARKVAERAAQRGRDGGAPRGLTVTVAGPDGASPALRVAAEPELVERALAPIIDNALRFAAHRIDVAVSGERDLVVFEVRDDGPGVDPTLGDRVFEPGVTGAPNGSGSGAGLGLALARRMARAAGGDVDRVPVASGAAFVVRLPGA